MHIDHDGNMELSAEENQQLMDQLGIEPKDYDNPPVEIELESQADGIATFRASNTRTGKSVKLEFEWAEDDE